MKNFTYQPVNEDELRIIGRYLRALPPIKQGNYLIEIKKNYPARSLSHLRYYRACLKIVAVATGNYDEDQLHEFCKRKFNGKLEFLPGGEAMMIGKSTSNMQSEEFSRFVGLCKAWFRDEFGVIIPEKKDLDYQKWLDIENSYNNAFRE